MAGSAYNLVHIPLMEIKHISCNKRWSPSEIGSYREINHIRDGEVIDTIDLYDTLYMANRFLVIGCDLAMWFL